MAVLHERQSGEGFNRNAGGSARPKQTPRADVRTHGDHIAAVRTISTNESPVSPTATQARIGGFARSAHSSHARFISSFCAMSVIKTKAVRIRPLIVPTSAKFAST